MPRKRFFTLTLSERELEMLDYVFDITAMDRMLTNIRATVSETRQKTALMQRCQLLADLHKRIEEAKYSPSPPPPSPEAPGEES